MPDIKELPEETPLERIVERYLVRRVELVEGTVRKLKWVGRRGAPDRLVLLPRCVVREHMPHIWFIELKRPKGGVLSAAQSDELAMLREYTGACVLINQDEIDGWMRRILQPAYAIRLGLR